MAVLYLLFGFNYLVIEEFKRRRSIFLENFPATSTIILPAYKTRYATRNIFYPWQQNTNLLYLSGFDEPTAALMADAGKWTLFCKENDAHSLTWTGPKCGPEHAVELLGVDSSAKFSELSNYLKKMETEAYWDVDENSCVVGDAKEHSTSKVKAILDRMRLKKTADEISTMKKAASIAANAFRETMRWSKFKSEPEIAAKIEFECKVNGAQSLAYVPVVAGGNHANIIHYTRNDSPIPPNDLVLLDAGARYNHYCSDVTRTFPISGKFTKAQRTIYGVVLKAHKNCLEILTENRGEISLEHLNYFVNEFYAQELGQLFGIKNRNVINRVFPHSIGHYLGMDLHDCPSISTLTPLESGMIITIEPGLYIGADDTAFPSEFRGIGIRIEDDVLIKDEGIEVLSEAAPKEIFEIESLMNQ